MSSVTGATLNPDLLQLLLNTDNSSDNGSFDSLLAVLSQNPADTQAQVANILSGNASNTGASGNSLDNWIAGSSSTLAFLNSAYTGFTNQLNALNQLSTSIQNDILPATQSMATLDNNASTADIQSAVKSFVNSFNQFQQSIQTSLGSNGALANSDRATQASFAISRDVTSPTYGSTLGSFASLASLGISQANNGLLQLNAAILAQSLDSNKANVVDVLNKMGAAANQSATFYTTNANEIPWQMNNLSSAMSWITNNAPEALNSDNSTSSGSALTSAQQKGLQLYQALINSG